MVPYFFCVFPDDMVSLCHFVFSYLYHSQADIRNPLRYAAHNQITAPQFIRRRLHAS